MAAVRQDGRDDPLYEELKLLVAGMPSGTGFDHVFPSGDDVMVSLVDVLRTAGVFAGQWLLPASTARCQLRIDRLFVDAVRELRHLSVALEKVALPDTPDARVLALDLPVILDLPPIPQPWSWSLGHWMQQALYEPPLDHIRGQAWYALHYDRGQRLGGLLAEAAGEFEQRYRKAWEMWTACLTAVDGAPTRDLNLNRETPSKALPPAG